MESISAYKSGAIVEHADIWDDVNCLWGYIYEDRKAEKCSIQFHSLLQRAQRTKDPRLVKCLMSLNAAMKSTDNERKLLLRTSKVGQKLYLPINIHNATPIPQNPESNCVSLGAANNLSLKYRFLKTLTADPNYDAIQQSPDIPDCSLVASLINIRKSSINLPPIELLPTMHYNINLHFNGSDERLVSVDPKNIPTTEDSSQLSLRSSNIEDKIVELAYLQVIGGTYMAEGSNAAIDTFRITGFLPEVVVSTKYDFKTLKNFFNSGSCLMAVGTGKESGALRDTLLANHDYCIEYIDTDNKEISLLDPLDSELRIKISADDFRRKIQQVYINWDYHQLFAHRQSFTFFYDSAQCNKFSSNIDKPLFEVVNTSTGRESVWILLETHISESKEARTQDIAYLTNYFDSDIFKKIYIPEGSAADLGLHLLKLELKPLEKYKLLCYSSSSHYFTIHLHSILPNIKFTRASQRRNAASVHFEEEISSLNTTYASPYYFTNPAFKLKIENPKGTKAPLNVDLQLLSEMKHLPLNLQIFEYSDWRLQKPILFDNYYDPQHYNRFGLPLNTSIDYVVVCSCQSDLVSHESFKLVASTSSSKEECTMTLEQVSLKYGGLLHQQSMNILFEQGRTRVKVSLACDHNNEYLIRVIPDPGTSVGVACSIFEEKTHSEIYHDKQFYDKGILIPHLRIDQTHSPVLLLELEDIPLTEAKFSIFVGSRWKVTLSPHP
ncbi:Rim13p KNAG_0A05230 [Huiozyma naganishii CBS 8797]|uniref:Cysteine protease RIM13 n=1 Tax=Huiozyma naganishii (strain ATCC MYA-139 / BCRC 22969 / CBS 8797 / KCTC 17520 / NBRC 10181 / NCYC 3082 / Yp74L-3) TaxID=1071383 RepID=J7S2I1_HUIN7|nr:hypothetical protein KNAG_0A05230 [Kazachstania naganishii CBS 8797]CCK68189.1 hypothetical protein KNAG_0A05230 [Kazachstania naganishii CBS 8797]